MRRSLGAIAAVVLAAQTAFAHEEILVGTDGAGKLTALVDEPFELPESIFQGYDGWASGFPGFFADPAASDPNEAIFALPDGSDLEFELLRFDPGMRVLNDHGSAYLELGERYHLGGVFFDVHPLWNITDGVVGDPLTMDIRIYDRNGLSSQSEEITLTFIPVPEPATGFAFIALISMAAARRR